MGIHDDSRQELEPQLSRDPNQDAVDALDRFHEVFHIDDMLALDEYQKSIELPQLVRKPFSDDFIESCEGTLALLTDADVVYDDELEDRMYEDEILIDLMQMKQRHEGRRLADGSHVTPQEVTTAFWLRRNLLAYIKSLENDVKEAYDEFPGGESSQAAS